MRTLANLLLSLMLIILMGLTSLCQAASISGTVSNLTGKTGRIYIKATPTDWGGDWSYGISIPAAGSYTISGLPDSFNGGYSPATYTLSAFVDTQGNGAQHANDPTVTLGSPVTIGSSTANLTLATPTPAVAPQANEIIAYQGNGGNTVLWKPYETDSSLPIADKYVVSWNTSESDSGASTREVPSGPNSYLFFHNGGGTNLYYKVTAYVGATPASTGWVPVTTRTGGVTVSGAVTLSGVGTSKPLVVLLKQEVPGQYPVFYSTIIPTPSTSGANSYSISNVPAGTYTFFAFLDVNGDGIHGPGDLDYRPGIYASEEVVVGASNTAGISPTITQRNAYATIRTNNWTSDGSTTNKNLGFTVEGQARQPVNVYVSGGGLQDNTPVGIDDEGEFRIWPGLSGVIPETGNQYTYTVQYSDSTSDTFPVTVGTFLTSFAGNLSPTGTIPYTNGIPTFSWSAPASPPSPYHYYLWLSGADAYWNTDDLPSTQTSILYNADGGASRTTLTAGVPYYWTLTVSDRYGNQAAYQTSFTMSGSASTISFTGKTVSPFSGNLSGVRIELDGDASKYTTSGSDGSFTLSNLPASTTFRLKTTLSGYLPVYTQYFNSSTSLDLSGSPYNLFTQSQLSTYFSQTSGKGVIIAGFMDSTTGSSLTDVTVTVPGYTPQYSNGLAMIFNVSPNTPVTITPSKTGYTFSQQTFSVPADSVLEAGIFGSPVPTSVSFTSKTVIAGTNGTPLPGVTITQVDPNSNNASTGNSTQSGSDGSFTLTNLPISTQFRLLMTYPSGGYLPVYSQRFNSSSNINYNNYNYFLVPVGSITSLQSGKGVIFARLIDSSTGSALSGATAVATAGYTVQYRNVAAGDWSGTATDTSGQLRIVNVPPNTNISLAPVKSGYTFSSAPYTLAVLAADSVFETNLFASPGTTYTLGVQRSGSGSGTIQIQANGLPVPTCSETSCSYSGLPAGLSIQLTAVPASGSSFITWSNCGSSTSVCSFTLTSDTLGVTATFGLQPFKIEDTTTYYNSLFDAFTYAAPDKKIRGQKSYEAPATAFNRSISTDLLTFKGGYDDSFSDSRGPTDFSTVGPLTIQSGSLVLDQIIIK
ncbi:hypothetical protein SAMN02745119_01911 [Trichlorobacter thiogenes]|uniref:Fibronectin type-III domain-containing protein n=1 Tax=Trichlorobacter thiogenes TaxID=115783 RepID=A0A1T4PB31_9BACT|nr:hypothetical protein [Trichlorobacter thiogenes]SJZ88753.1 hypothetical protein SAMN02745119_01911 [Trichlorobacter thiogenes]